MDLITYKNRILYRTQNDPFYEGEIVLDLINLKYGKGIHYYNDPPFNNKKNKNMDTQEEKDNQNSNCDISDQFGFAQFILTKDKICVEHPYIKPDENKPPYGEIRYQASIWERESDKT